MPLNDDQNDYLKRVFGLAPANHEAGEHEANEAEDDQAELDSLGLDHDDLWRAARAAFDTATEKVDAQIAALQAALRNSGDAELAAIADLGLNGVTGGTRVPLMSALKEAGAGGQDAKKAAPKLLNAIGAFRSHITSDPQVAAYQDNPCDVAIDIIGTFESALDQLETAAKRIAKAA